MEKSNPIIVSIACFSAIMLGGCTASKNIMQHASLKTETKMSSTIFLDPPLTPQQRMVLLQIRNTSDKTGFNPKDKIVYKLTNYGYKITDDPNKAHYLLQANILKVGEAKPEDGNALLGGYGAALEGAAVGGLVGLYSNNHMSPLTGGLAGAAIGAIADSMIKNVTINVITDIQISEKTNAKVSEINNANLTQGTSGSKQVVSNETTNWKRYQTRIVSSANKVNLDFVTAEPELIDGLAQSISGIFG